MSILVAPLPSVLDVREDTQSESPRRSVTAARRFVWTGAAVYFSGLLVLAGFSIYANPWGNYGEAGFLDPSEYNDRLVKAKYIDGLSADERPQALVLGCRA